MRVVIGLVSLDPGGTELQSFLLANELVTRGHEVTIYLTSNNDTCLMGPRRFTIRPNDTRYIRHIPYTLQIIPTWRRWLIKDQPHIMVGALTLPHTILAAASLGLNIPLIGRRGFNWDEILHLPNYQKAFKRVRQFRHFVIRRTKHMVCNADHVRLSTVNIEGWPEHKTSVIHNGWPEYSTSPSGDTLRAIYAGRNRIEKECNIPGVERVTTIPIWSTVGIYVHPTYAEGCSNAIGMAMAHGIPVIAMGTKGNKELLGEDYYALVNDDFSMSKWLNLLQSSVSMRQRLSEMCRQRVRTHYSLKVMVDSWEQLMESYHESNKRN